MDPKVTRVARFVNHWVCVGMAFVFGLWLYDFYHFSGWWFAVPVLFNTTVQAMATQKPAGVKP